jgi:hypothetical protein
MQIHLSVLALLTCLLLPSGNSQSQTPKAPSTPPQSMLSLNPTNKGQHLSVGVGEIIKIDLQTLTTAGYGTPQISTPNIRFQNLVTTGLPNPGSPQPLYMFEALSAGTAEIEIQSSNPENAPFNVTIDVLPDTRPNAIAPVLDQASSSDANAGSTILTNDLRQTFVPTLPRLTKVEVELAVLNPGKGEDEVEMWLLNSKGETLADAFKSIPASAAGWATFVFPNLDFVPGETYCIRVYGGDSFGWKYVTRGYNRGEALWNHKPFGGDGRRAFLFRTYGEKMN